MSAASPTAVSAEASRRDDIVDVASRLFALRGYHGVGVRAIAAQVGVQPASIYHYFQSKADILDAIIADVTERFISSHVYLLDPSSVSAESMQQLVFEHIVYFWHHRVAESVGLREMGELPPERAEQVRRIRRSYQDAWSHAIESATRRGILGAQDPRIAALALLSMINGVNAWYRESGPLGIEQVAEIYADLAVGQLLRAL